MPTLTPPDEEKKKQPPEGDPELGDYTPPEDLPIPGETEGIDNAQL